MACSSVAVSVALSTSTAINSPFGSSVDDAEVSVTSAVVSPVSAPSSSCAGAKISAIAFGSLTKNASMGPSSLNRPGKVSHSAATLGW